MVLVGTQLNVCDNTGVLKVNCIKILGSSKCNHARIGDTLVVSVRQSKSISKIKKGSVHLCVLVRKRAKTSRKNGSSFSFDENSVVLIKTNKKKNKLENNPSPIGNRLVGSVTSELRYRKCLKIPLLAWNVV